MDATPSVVSQLSQEIKKQAQKTGVNKNIMNQVPQMKNYQGQMGAANQFQQKKNEVGA